MKDALVIVMLVLLIGPLLIGVQRIRRLPRASEREEERDEAESADRPGPDPSRRDFD